MPAGERFPEQDADRPDVRRGPRLFASKALWRNVRKRSRNVSGGGQGLFPVHSRKSEVEQADRDLVALGEQDVRGLDVAVDDSVCMGVRERLADLRGDLEGGRVVDRAFPKRLPQRSTRHVLVGDVDVAGVPRKGVCPLAAWMAEARSRRGLSLGAGGRFPLPRHDLERHLDAGRLVAGEPNRAVAAAAERLQGTVPAENEFVRGDGESRF